MASIMNSQRANATEETKEAVLKPKRPLSAYMLFTMDRRLVLRAAGTSLSSKDFLKEMGKEWKVLSISRKQAYESNAEALKTQYKADLEAYERGMKSEKPQSMKDGKRKKAKA
jgi:hypothetical protein